MKKTRSKNRAAVALGRRSGIRLSPEQRSERGRRAVQARWRKAKAPSAKHPQRFWCFFARDDQGELQLLFSSRNKEEVIARSRTPECRARLGFVDFVEHDPNPPGFTFVGEFKPETGAVVKALEQLQTLSNTGTEQTKRSQS